MTEILEVALVEDDAAVLDALALYLERRGLAISRFESADALVASGGRAPPFDCIVADVRMPGMSGLDLVRHYADAPAAPPVILITGHGDVDMAVAAIKLGAFDFIEKPFDENRLFETIGAAVTQARARQQDAVLLADLQARFESLSERQHEVLALATAGLSNKEIAARLGISPRTVEIHRAWVMERMGARNLAELVRMEMRLRPPGR
ncbi:response regulator [Rhodoplanes sp. TEM]|uniref:Response regulator n=1 Tax=Rhodoplanes tepidamans TaxID=200616 RepID=A0ABT5JDQ7_RHOTP|nr:MULTISPECIES: response regulator [Rhodoplanes]MDC7787657.1 response regulator [Rhodoplanes tepidamans]MDC7987970.1 response regulator [Rhodoplanes sp. TEM]MDQ0355227.1 two-component system response regulator FixJ [Rhodoplanes tepidamans]